MLLFSSRAVLLMSEHTLILTAVLMMKQCSFFRQEKVHFRGDLLWHVSGDNSYKETGHFIQQLQKDRILHTIAKKRQDTSYNSYKETGHFMQQLQKDRILHTTATQIQDTSHNSYKETGHFLQKLQRDRTLHTIAIKRQDTSYNSYKETGHFIQQLQRGSTLHTTASYPETVRIYRLPETDLILHTVVVNYYNYAI